MSVSSISDDWMNDPFFTGSDAPIPDDWYNDPFFNDDNIPRDEDKPTNDDLFELEPTDSDESDPIPRDEDKPTNDDLFELEPPTDNEEVKSNTSDKKDSGESSRNKDKDDKDLLKEIDKWLDFGIKQVDRIVDVATGNKPKEKVKIKTFDDIKINVPTKKRESAETIFGRYMGMSVGDRKTVVELIRNRGDFKETNWRQIDIYNIKKTDIKIDDGYTAGEVFDQYLALSQDQRWRFIKIIDESEQAFTIEVDSHSEVLDSVQRALKAHE